MFKSTKIVLLCVIVFVGVITFIVITYHPVNEERKELSITPTYYNSTSHVLLDRYGNPMSEDRNYGNCFKYDDYPNCPQQLLDENKINKMTEICLEANYPYYDLEKDRCYYLGFRSESLNYTNQNDGKIIVHFDGKATVLIKDVKMFASETESHPELALIAKLNCNKNDGAWLDDACWVVAPDDENYCATFSFGYGQLWREMDNPTNEVCYGDSYLDELWSQMKPLGVKP